MKHIVIFILIISSLVLGSCSKSFLDTKNPSSIFATGFFKDSATIASGVTGAYNALQSFFGSGTYGMFMLGDVATDNSWSRVTGATNWDPLLIIDSDPGVQSFWISLYRTIGRANAIIKEAPGISISETAKQRFTGEAKFLRALSYFYALRMWGQVPLSTEPFDSPQDAYVNGRNSVDDIYKLILEDVADAYNSLPNFYARTNTNAGRATKAAAIALWGEVLLTQKKYTEAAAKLAEIVNNESVYGVSLLPDYSKIFATDNEMNSEIIFAERYTAGFSPSIGSSFNNQFMPIGVERNTGDAQLSKTTAYSGNLITYNLLQAFEEGDKRKAASVDSIISEGVMRMYSKKYLNANNATVNDGSNDWIVYRYADVLLMYAEALNESNKSDEANNMITKVRVRAGLDALEYTGQADLRAKLLNERRVELNMEGKRWFDLVRNGNLLSTLNDYYASAKEKGTNFFEGVRVSGTPIESFRLLLPIPASEIRTNPKLSPNNDGYN